MSKPSATKHHAGFGLAKALRIYRSRIVWQAAKKKAGSQTGPKPSWVLFFACSDNNWVPTVCLGTCAVRKLVLKPQLLRAIVLKSSSSIKPPVFLGEGFSPGFHTRWRSFRHRKFLIKYGRLHCHLPHLHFVQHWRHYPLRSLRWRKERLWRKFVLRHRLSPWPACELTLLACITTKLISLCELNYHSL